VRGSDAAWRPGWVDGPEYPNAAINDEIITRRGASDTLRFFEKKGVEFNFVNAVTALHRIAKAKDGPSICDSPGFAQLLALATSGLPGVDAGVGAAECQGKGWPPPPKHHQNMSNIAWALAKLSIEDEPCFQAIAASAMRILDAYKPQDLANTPWAFAKCACHA